MGDSLGVYLLRRLLLAIPVLIGVSFLSFVLVAAWLNPFWQGLGPTQCQVGAQPHGACSKQIQAAIAYYHVNEHLVPRWFYWVKDVFNGHANKPIVADPRFAKPIWPEVASATAHTALLVGFALLLTVMLSIAIGTLSARRAGRPSDVTARGMAYVAWSLPAFLVAVLLQQLFVHITNAYRVVIFYVGGTPGPEAGTGFHYVLDWTQHLALPVIALALGGIGVYSRYIRSAMLVTLYEPYTIAARARGLDERRLTTRYALRNALIPFVNVVALDFGAIVGASLAVDYVFALHGLGTYLSVGLFNADPYEVEPVILIAAAVVILSRVVADLATWELDPRVRLA